MSDSVKDLVVVNGWALSGLPGVSDQANFETLDGVGVGTGNVEAVDGRTNKKKRFVNQIVDFKETTLTRTFQSTVDDYAIQILVFACIRFGLKLDTVTAKKFHHRSHIFSYFFRDFKFHDVTFPTWDTEGEEKFVVTYLATHDDAFMTPRFLGSTPVPPVSEVNAGDPIST